MPQLSYRPPKLSRRTDGVAYVTINRKKIYLGQYGTPETLQRYKSLINEMQTTNPVVNYGEVCVNDLLLAYLEFYMKENPTSQRISSLKTIAKIMSELYGNEPVDKFRTVALMAVQNQLANTKKQNSDLTLSRDYVNELLSMIHRMFKWGVAHEIVQEETWRVLLSVEPLKKGKARESTPRQNIPADVVERTMPYLSQVIVDMIQFQLLTDCRPGEMFIVRKCDIRNQNGVAVYTPAHNKNEWRGQERHIVLNQTALDIVNRRAHEKNDNDYVFAPIDAVNERRETQAQNRKSKLTQAQQKRHEQAKTKKFTPHYTKDSFRTAITRGIERANKNGENIPYWTPAFGYNRNLLPPTDRISGQNSRREKERF